MTTPYPSILVIMVCLFCIALAVAPLYLLLNHGPSDEARVSATYNRPPYAR